MGSQRTSILRTTGRRVGAGVAVVAAVGIGAVVLAPNSDSVVAATSTTPASSAPPAPTTVGGPTVTRGADFPASGVLAAGQHTVVLTQRSGASATLFAGVDGATPTAVPGVGALPSWAQPHVGTDAKRRRVIVYPRCSTAAVRSCDLYQYDIDAKTERMVPKVNAAGVGETEGSMEKGAIAFTRWTSNKKPKDFDNGVTTTVLYRPASGATRVVTRKGGQQIALHGSRIVLVRDVQPSYGVCGRPGVQLLRLDGTRQVLRGYRCGMDSHRPVSPTFLGDRIVWAMLSVSEVVFSQWNAPAQRVATQRLEVAGSVAYAPVTWSRALVLTPQYSAATLTYTLVSAWNITPA